MPAENVVRSLDTVRLLKLEEGIKTTAFKVSEISSEALIVKFTGSKLDLSHAAAAGSTKVPTIAEQNEEDKKLDAETHLKYRNESIIIAVTSVALSLMYPPAFAGILLAALWYGHPWTTRYYQPPKGTMRLGRANRPIGSFFGLH